MKEMLSYQFREVLFLAGGLLKIEGDQVLFLRLKGGIKSFSNEKGGDHLHLLKK